MNDLPVFVGSIENYMNAIRRYPILTHEEEIELAIKKDAGDIEAAQKLVLSHLRYVVSTARAFENYGLPMADLIQEGNIGLMKAVKAYDVKKGVRVCTFALANIKYEIYEYVIRNWRIVKMSTTKAQRKLFFNLRTYIKNFNDNSRRFLSNDQVIYIAKELNVPEYEVRTIEGRLYQTDEHFNSFVDEDNDLDAFAKSPEDLLGDMSLEPFSIVSREDHERKQLTSLHDALATLDDRRREVVTRRFLTENPEPLRKIAEDMGVSTERIRQLEKQGLEKLKLVLSHPL